MITTLKTPTQIIAATTAFGMQTPAQNAGNVVTLPVARPVKTLGQTAPAQPAEARPANHNLTRDARRSNVVLLSHFQTTDDFPPDLGARPALAA